MRHALQDPGKIFQMISDQFSSMNPENTKHSLGFSSILHNSGESSSRQENESSPKERLCVNLGNCSDSVRKRCRVATSQAECCSGRRWRWSSWRRAGRAGSCSRTKPPPTRCRRAPKRRPMMTTAWWSSSSWSRGQLRPTCSQSPPSERPLIPETNILEWSMGSN